MGRDWKTGGVQAAVLSVALLVLGAPAKAQNAHTAKPDESGPGGATVQAVHYPAAAQSPTDRSSHYPAKPVDETLMARMRSTPAPATGSASSSAWSEPASESSTPEPITAEGRLRWFVRSTVGPVSLAGGVFSSAFGTGLDDPHEYGGSWRGFGERYGMRLTGVSTSNAMEAGLGAMSGEDPRYFRDPDAPFGSRVWHVIRMTFVARQNNGTFAPAYARYAAIGGSNFISNRWRVRSESGPGHAAMRIAEGFEGRMAGNAFSEFWPDVTERIGFLRSPHVSQALRMIQ